MKHEITIVEGSNPVIGWHYQAHCACGWKCGDQWHIRTREMAERNGNVHLRKVASND